ncbi:MAG: hypothetical protein NTU95_11980 [Methanothrix sp.]|nr:hypothetical protein [Methanothrix sp.]
MDMIADLKPASSLIDDQCEAIWLSRRDLWPFDPVKGRGSGPEARQRGARRESCTGAGVGGQGRGIGKVLRAAGETRIDTRRRAGGRIWGSSSR